MEPRRFLLMLALIIIVLLAVTIWFYPTIQDFRTDNPSWNGMDTFGAKLQALPLESLGDLPAAPKRTSLVVIPYTGFTQLELKYLNNYVSRGGTLVLADDYGHGNEVLSYLGSKARFTQEPLLDPVFNYKSEWLPRITNLTNTLIMSGVESLLLNHATALSGLLEGEGIAFSSNFSFLDMNYDSTWHEGEPMSSLPVASRSRLGQGWLVLIADPSILINSMVEMEDNQLFLENVLREHNSATQVLVDQSHLPKVELDKAKKFLAISRNVFATLGGTLGLTALVLTLTLKPIWRKNKPIDKEEDIE